MLKYSALFFVFILSAPSIVYASGGPSPPRYTTPSYLDPDYEPANYDVFYGQTTKTDRILQQYFPANGNGSNWPYILTVNIEPETPKSELEKVKGSVSPGELKPQEGNLASYPTCTANSYKSAKKFIAAIADTPSVKENFQSLLKIRQEMLLLCSEDILPSEELGKAIRSELEILNEKEGLSVYANYLSIATYFYAGDYNWAFRQFSDVADMETKGPLDEWAKETATYMKARALLVEAQGEWSGLPQDITPLLQDRARSSLEAFQDYLQKYPEGMFKETSTNIQNRIYFILREQDNLDKAIKASLTTQLDAVNDESSEKTVYLLMRDVDRFFKGKVDITSDNPILVSYLVMGMEKKDFNRDFISKLEAQQNRFSRYPGLFKFLRAWSLYKAQFYQELLDKTPATSLKNGKTVNISTEIIRAEALSALKRYKDALNTLMLVHNVTPEEAVELDIVSIQLKRGHTSAIFTDAGRITSLDILRDVAQFALYDEDIIRALGKDSVSNRNRLLLTEELMKRYLLTHRFEEMNALYEQGVDTGVFSPLKQLIADAAASPNDNKTLLEIGKFLYENGISSQAPLGEGSMWETTGRDELFPKCEGCSDFDQRRKDYDSAFVYFKTVFDQSEKSDTAGETGAEALHYMIRCFRGPEYRYLCQGDTPFENQSKKWFLILHSKYKDSIWSKKSPYYYD